MGSLQFIQICEARVQRDWVRPFLGVSGDRTRGKEHKRKHRRFSLNIRKIFFFPVRLTEHYHVLLGEAMESSFLEIPRSLLDMVLVSQLWASLHEQEGWISLNNGKNEVMQ